MVSAALASAINSAKISGGGKLIADTLVQQTKETITNTKIEAQEAAANPALNITSQGQALADAAKTPFVSVSSFSNGTQTPQIPLAIVKATDIATSTVQNVQTNGVAPLNNTIAEINKTASEDNVKHVEQATNNVQAVLVKANDTAAQTVTVVEAVAQAVNQSASNKIDNIQSHLETLANASAISIPQIHEKADDVVSVAVSIKPNANIDSTLASNIKDVTASNDLAATSSTATSATQIIQAAAPVIINTTTKPEQPKISDKVCPSYNGESLQLGFGYDFKLCNGICNTQDSYLYEQTRAVGNKYIFRCHCKADFSVWFFRENADRFTACPENDLSKCYLHYFGNTTVETVAKDNLGHITNPCLNDVINRIDGVDKKINDEETKRRYAKSFLKPSKADEFVADVFKPKNLC